MAIKTAYGTQKRETTVLVFDIGAAIPKDYKRTHHLPVRRDLPIKAKAWSDDRKIEVAFDAKPWFRQASDDAILNLVIVGWGDAFEADIVAEYCEPWPGSTLDRLFKYLKVVNHPATGDIVGFECRVDQASAMVWLEEHRPDIYTRIIAYMEE